MKVGTCVWTSVILCAAAASSAWADGTYQFALNAQSSVLSTELSVSAPTTGTLIGSYDAASNPTGTRTKPGIFGTFGETENVPVPVTVGLAIGGNNSTHPTGNFILRLDIGAGEAGLSGLGLDLLGGEDIAVNATANLNWSTFRTRSPTCLVLGGITIPFPLGQAVVSSLTAVQGEDEAIGTLVGTGGTYTVVIPVEVEVTLAAAFLGQEIPPTPQVVPLVFAATVTLDGSGGAAIGVELEGLEISQGQEGPLGEPFEVPFTEPICQGNLVFTLQLQGLTAAGSLDAALVADGTKVTLPSCPCDWDGSGAIGVPDIFAFLSTWFAGQLRADFDGSGSVGVPDIFAFLSCWFARPGSCA